jgi:ABC-type uncharacterized transport system auxiliary subunit
VTFVRLIGASAVSAALIVGCTALPLRYYQAQVATDQVKPAPTRVPASLAVAEFSVDQAYDDQRIVYRTSQQRFDYYHFHRWASDPGQMLSVVLREAYRQGGYFGHVLGGFDASADFRLEGRVVALEEVDHPDGRWEVHVAVELTLREGSTARVLWSNRVDEREALPQRSPEGVAIAAGNATTRIATRTAPVLADMAQRALERRD